MEVSAKVRVPIATGENLFLFEGFEEIIAKHALSIVTPDLQKVGGSGYRTEHCTVCRRTYDACCPTQHQ